MKLHLPKMLLSAVVAAGTLCSQAYAGWGNDTGSSYYESDALEIEAISTYDAAAKDVYQIKPGSGKSGQHTIGKLTIHGDKTVRLMWNWLGNTSLNALIGELQIGQDGTGTTTDLRNDAGNVISISKVSGTLANLYNGGTMTIGGADTTTTIGGTLYNNGPTKGGTDTTSAAGTMTLNGAISVTIDDFNSLVMNTAKSGDISYSAGDNGYRGVQDAYYYLVKGANASVSASTASLKLGSAEAKNVSVVSETDGVSISVGDVYDNSWYYVNTEVTYGGEGGVNEASGFALNGGTLNLNSDVDSSVVTGGIKALTGTTSTLNLANNVTIGTNAVTMESGATVNLKGSGTVAITEGTSVRSNSVLPYTCAEGWTGTVDFTNCTAEGMNFQHYGVAGSTIRLNGVTGWFKQGFTSAANVLLEGDGMVVNASSNSTNRFNGKVSGAGDITYSGTLGYGHKWEAYFSGDTSEWSGNIEINGSNEGATNAVSVVDLRFNGGGQIFDADGNSAITNNRVASYTQEVEQEVDGSTQTVQQTVNIGAVNVYIGKSGETSYMNAAITNANTGTLNVTATNNTVFNKAIDVSSLTVNDGATATLKADSSTGTVTVNGSGALEFDGGTLTVSSALTLDASAIRIAESLTQDTTRKTLITMSGEGSTLTVNNVDSWTGGTYTIDGTKYTTTLSNSGSALDLVFEKLPTTLTLVADFVSLEGSDLVLSVDANLAAAETLTLTLSDSALAAIAGQGGLVTLKVEGLVDTSLVGDGLGNVSFYGTYTGEGAGQYQLAYIPEPTTATLSLLALAGLAARRRRK